MNQQDVGSFSIDKIFDKDVTSLVITSGATPWLSVRLASPAYVSSVAVYNRADNFAYLLGTFSVWVGNSYASGNAGVSAQTATQCGVTTSTATAGPFVVSCSPAVFGSHITVRQEAPAEGYLTIAEVVVN